MVQPDDAQNDCRRLASLLSLGTDSDPDEAIDPERERTWALRDCLASIPPLSPTTIAVLPALLQRLFRGMPRLVGQSLDGLISDPECRVDDLKVAKDHVKHLMKSARTQAEQDAAEAIYYAVIASSLVFCDQKITQHSYEDLEKAFSLLSARDWGHSELQRLFTRAGEICLRRQEL